MMEPEDSHVFHPFIRKEKKKKVLVLEHVYVVVCHYCWVLEKLPKTNNRQLLSTMAKNILLYLLLSDISSLSPGMIFSLNGILFLIRLLPNIPSTSGAKITFEQKKSL